MAIAESCVDAVVMEMVAVYCGGLYTAKPELAARRIEAIGFQVGHQLSERYNQKQIFFSPVMFNSLLRFQVQTLTNDLSS
jgi:trafficking protein particle complex subunit 6